ADVLIDGAGSHIYSDNGTTDAFAGLTTNAASGQFTIQNGASLNRGSSAFNNAGTFTIGTGSTLTVGTYSQTGGGTIVQGFINGTMVSIQGGTLSGAGTIAADVTNAGQVSPGSSPGLLTIDGNYVQTSTGALAMEIGGTTPETGFDQLVVSGSATLAG